MSDASALPHITVAAIVPLGTRLLFVEEHSEGRSVINQPAGHLDPGESLLQAVVRETLEESAWQVRPVALTGIYQLFRPGIQFVRVCFLCEPLAEVPGRALDQDIVGTHWLTRDELLASSVPTRSSLVLRCVDDYLQGRRYPLDLLTEPQW